MCSQFYLCSQVEEVYSPRGGQSIIVACFVCSVRLWFPRMLDLRPIVAVVVAIEGITDATPLDEKSVKESSGSWCVLMCC